ncbi:MAG: hypothetical protein MO853_10275 [Candidatus Protistobacter heckmanni]|nr:hypothetical protein [Candidatus Protistobacter heckmanni]
MSTATPIARRGETEGLEHGVRERHRADDALGHDHIHGGVQRDVQGHAEGRELRNDVDLAVVAGVRVPVGEERMLVV